MVLARFFKDLITGLGMCFYSVEFIFKNRLWPYFLYSALVAGVCIWLGFYVSQDALDHQIPDAARGDVLSLTWEVGKWFARLVLLIMLLKLNKYIVLVLLPPVLAKASERTEYLIAGTKYKFNLRQFLNDIKRSLKIAGTNFLWEAGLLLLFMFIALIFGSLKPLYPYYSFVIGFYFYGFSMLDYSLERRRLSMEESKRFIRHHMGLAVAIGLVYSALFLLHLDFGWFTDHPTLKNLDVNIGVIFAPVICVVAATRSVHKRVDLSTNPYANPTGSRAETPRSSSLTTNPEAES